jgi:hypothetical protein
MRTTTFEEAAELALKLNKDRPPIHHPVTREEVERILAKQTRRAS